LLDQWHSRRVAEASVGVDGDGARSQWARVWTYTNTVGVSAVRDLYGAMTSERAAKGILVTTATFGHDSYELVKDKPIILLDGSGLLHLLQKHGVPTTIDLKQAKQPAIN
jgi:restriction endonuclease Mrr